MSKPTVARIGTAQEESFPKHPSHYLGLDWIERKNVQALAYGLRVNAELAMLAYKGLVVHQAEAGLPYEDTYVAGVED